jgi:hypothetical protein
MNIYAVGMYIEYELDKPVEFFLTKELARAYLVKQAQNTDEKILEQNEDSIQFEFHQLYVEEIKVREEI